MKSFLGWAITVSICACFLASLVVVLCPVVEKAGWWFVCFPASFFAIALYGGGWVRSFQLRSRDIIYKRLQRDPRLQVNGNHKHERKPL
jgi:hypothetical protein